MIGQRGVLRSTAIGITTNPTGHWTTQAARNFVMRYDRTIRFLIRDGAGQFIAGFDGAAKRWYRSSQGTEWRTAPTTSNTSDSFVVECSDPSAARELAASASFKYRS